MRLLPRHVSLALFVLTAALARTPPLFAQDALTLEVKGGDVKVVKIDRTVVIPTDVTVVSSFPFKVQTDAKPNTTYRWTVPPNVYAVPAGNALEVRSAPQGELIVDLYAETFAVKNGELTVAGKAGKVTLHIGAPGPGPKPPGPKPPDPPAPKPEPKPAVGLKVLFVEESADRPKLPQQQHSILAGKEMRAWLDANVSPDTLYPKGYAIWDKDVGTENLPDHWKKALAAPRQSLPWVVVMDGQGTVVGGFALPADTAATIAELSKYLPRKGGQP